MLDAVVLALRAAHPYEEPAFMTWPVDGWRTLRHATGAVRQSLPSGAGSSHAKSSGKVVCGPSCGVILLNSPRTGR